MLYASGIHKHLHVELSLSLEKYFGDCIDLKYNEYWRCFLSIWLQIDVSSNITARVWFLYDLDLLVGCCWLTSQYLFIGFRLSNSWTTGRDVSDSQRGRAGVRAIQRRDIPPRDVACVGEARRVPVGGVYQVSLSTPDWPKNSSQ